MKFQHKHCNYMVEVIEINRRQLGNNDKNKQTIKKLHHQLPRNLCKRKQRQMTENQIKNRKEQRGRKTRFFYCVSITHKDKR